MTRHLRRIASLRRLALVAALFGVAVLLPADDVRGFGIAQLMTEKSLPPATVDVIDPESGTSSGSGPGEIKLADGDVILFRFAVSGLPDARTRGMQTYLTEYVPPGTQLVGVRLIDKNGLTIEPRMPGIAVDGCSGGSNCTTFTNLPCTAGNCNFRGGSISHVHADTGIFWTSDARLMPLSSTDTTAHASQFLTPLRGITMSPAPDGIAPDLTQLLEFSAPYKAHNDWDWIQVQAFGTSTSAATNKGKGNMPFRYGSPVAGPFTYYDRAAVDTNASPTAYTIQFNNDVGPWQRVRYPGSKIGYGASSCTDLTGSRNNCGCIANGGLTCTSAATNAMQRKVRDYVDTGTQASSEWNNDVTPANPVSPVAVRYAMGEGRADEPLYAEVALRVNGSPPIDAFFDEDNNPGNGISGGNLDCAEVIGGSLAGNQNGNDGDHNPWRTYLPTTQCVFLRLLFDLTVTPDLSYGSTLSGNLRIRNLKLTDENNPVVYLMFEANDTALVTTGPNAPNPPADGPVTGCPAQLDPSGTKECLTYTIDTSLKPGAQMEPSDEIELNVHFTPGGSGHTSGVITGFYTSDSLPLANAGMRTDAVTIVKPIAKPSVTLAFPNPTTSFASLGLDSVLTGTVSNAGTNGFSWSKIVVNLPSGWTVRNTGGAATEDISIGGAGCATHATATRFECTANCGTSSPSFDFSDSFAIGASCPLSITVRPATTPSPALYPIDLALWGSQTGFGGTTETYFAKAAIVPLGQPRSEKPVIDCPIGSTATSISGTSEPDAAISLKFSLIERGTGTADGGGDWTVNNYGAFGGLYGGLEVRATAKQTGELESELSDACFVTAVRECSDGIDNDVPPDGLIDFPADPGCESATDNSEADTNVEECRDTVNNDADAFIDWPADLQCSGPYDDSEAGNPACSDGIDNDGDGFYDDVSLNPTNPDPDCTGPNDPDEAYLRECQDRLNNGDGDTDRDFDGVGGRFTPDADCHSAFDDDEGEPNFVSSDVRGRILIVFDTSGSMNWNVCEDVFTNGDGSDDFPGDDVACVDLPPLCTAGQLTCNDGQSNDSRLFKVKKGISDVVASFGEVEYALMRFHQRPVDFGPPTRNASQSSGGWQGGGARVGDPAQCSGGFNAGDLLVSFSDDNYQTILDWMDGSTNYPEGVPPPGLDEELRGTGTTPIAGSLDSALTYLQSVVAAGDPYVEGCRDYRVILVTDGEDTCSADPINDPPAAALALKNAGFPVTVIGFATGDPTVKAKLDAIANAGGTSTAIFASDEAALSGAMADVVASSIRFEICNGQDDDCDTLVDEGFNVGDPTADPPIPPDTCIVDLPGDVCDNTGFYECTADGSSSFCNAVPNPPTGTDEPPEGCNGIDDDCDGLIDEGVQPCFCGSIEICNGIDDTCDGNVDEAPIAGEGDDCGIDIGACEFGHLECDGTATPPHLVCVGAVGPTGETCNCIDDDCDTQVDEGVTQCYDAADGGCTFDSGTQTWSCQGLCRTGLRSCDTSACPTTGADGPCMNSVSGTAELCNGYDDDCDGLIDEDFKSPTLVPGLGDACDNGLDGVCNAPGVYVCTADGSGIVCNAPTITPGVEVCNGYDDDCNGTIDDGLGPPIGQNCGGGSGCSGGTFQCVDPDSDPATPNSTVQCVGATGGGVEVCNGIDDDCDTLIDESPTDPEIGTSCTPPSTTVCTPGTIICQDGSLVCDGYTLPTTDICNGMDDDCDGQTDETDCAETAEPNDQCVQGECLLPCENSEFPCPFGQFCMMFGDTDCSTPDANGHCRFCVDDPCTGVTCGSGESCDPLTGGCVNLCDGVSCPDGEECRNGFCLNCFQLPCPDGQLCEIGVGCVDDPCIPNPCGSGTFCRDGDCVPLSCDPQCPDTDFCHDGVCLDNMCIGVQCPTNQVCNPFNGECAGDLCDGVNCPAGNACNPGTGGCIPDPCRLTQCPDGTSCEVAFDGHAICTSDAVNNDDEYVYAGGGGCLSASGGGAGGGAWLVALAALLMVRRRRRTR